MQYGRDEYLKTPYKTGTNTLNSESVVKDLGVHVSAGLSWETQIVEAIKMGRKFLWWILQSFTLRNPDVILFLYRSYVLPWLEYASLLWSPYQQKHIIKDGNQRRSSDLSFFL